jgi:hypothetical protein
MNTTTKSQLPAIGSRVRMTSENSNWVVGELGTVVIHHNGGNPTNDRFAVVFDGREDDYTAFPDDCAPLPS